MRRLRKRIAVLMSIAMLCTLVPTAIPAVTADNDTREVDNMILFSTSFEKGQSSPVPDTLEGERLSNVGEGGMSADLSESYSQLTLPGSILGSADFHDGESKQMLFDGDQNTKWLCNEAAPTENSPVWVSFSLSSATTANAYLLRSANDSPERDPMCWALYGSNDGSQWVELDRRESVYFNSRFHAQVYTFDNDTAYTDYRLEITKNRTNNTMTQLADLEIGTLSISDGNTSAEAKPLKVEVGSGPQKTWCNTASNGWTGEQALSVSGRNILSGKAYCTNVLYDNLRIPVTYDTELSYVIFPSMYDENFDLDGNGNDEDVYDFVFHNQHFMIDLAFSDGTYLSELGAVDQNGIDMTPQAQAAGKCLYFLQWNEVRCRIGEVAKGKTITKILLNYACDTAEGGSSFRAYFDDIVIKTEAVKEYEHLSDYVNTLRGTNSTDQFSRGLTIPAVSLPNGFNYYIPVTNTRSNAPYYYQVSASKNTISHFEITHIASNWVGGWGSWQFMANTSLNPASATVSELNSNNRAAEFTHDNEVAKAHYYSVSFDKGSKASGVKVEMTPNDHSLFARVTFPDDAANRSIIFDCDHASGDMTLNADGSFTAYSDHAQNGSTRMYIYGRFVDEQGNALTPASIRKLPYSDGAKNSAIGLISFSSDTSQVGIKLATSYIGYEQAQKNLLLEIGENETFDDVFKSARKIWDDLLGMVEIEGATEEQLITFYSCLYRMYLYPTNYSENIGTADKPKLVYASPYQNGTVVEGQLYTNNGFWDTYRTVWAGYALLTPNRDSDYLNGIIQHYKDSGWVPRWVNPAGTNSMVGTSSDVIFGDAAVKGINFDLETALLSAVKNASVVSADLTSGGRRSLESSNFLGYTSLENDQAFSWAMEGYINDYGISQLASVLGGEYADEADYFRNRSRYYVNLFNKELGWFMGRDKNGEFRTNDPSFDPSVWGWGGDYTETNAWNMAFSVVQDGQGLANLYGGRDKLKRRLDEFFTDDLRNTYSGTIHEMKEAREVRMGQYHHSNQPSHHIIYMYNYAGAPCKTAERVREILTHGYAGQNIGQGYIGDEDNGEMSAWYVLSSLGFYPVTMGNDEYAIGSPLFKKVTVHMDNGKKLIISAPENSRENIYIQSVKLNGKNYSKNYFKHADLANGAVIEFKMGNTSSDWGTTNAALPTSITKGGDTPQPAMDITSEMEISYIASGALANQGIDDIANLCDDNGDSYAAFSADTTSLYFTDRSGKAVALYTITSADSTQNAPTGYALYASNDKREWICLDKRTDVTFRWARYTKPFSINADKRGVYKYYRLDISGEGSIAEVELLGNDEPLSEGVAEPGSIKGDLTGDGKVTVSDIIALKKIIMSSEAPAADELSVADTTGDGKLTVSDILGMKNIILG